MSIGSSTDTARRPKQLAASSARSRSKSGCRHCRAQWSMQCSLCSRSTIRRSAGTSPHRHRAHDMCTACGTRTLYGSVITSGVLPIHHGTTSMALPFEFCTMLDYYGHDDFGMKCDSAQDWPVHGRMGRFGITVPRHQEMNCAARHFHAHERCVRPALGTFCCGRRARTLRVVL
jgi:hypothetical protein